MLLFSGQCTSTAATASTTETANSTRGAGPANGARGCTGPRRRARPASGGAATVVVAVDAVPGACEGFRANRETCRHVVTESARVTATDANSTGVVPTPITRPRW